MKKRKYSLRKSEKIFLSCHSFYNRKKKKLLPDQKQQLESRFSALKEALKNKDREEASKNTHLLQEEISTLLPKNFFDQTLDIVLSIGFALIVAIIVRQVWFEPNHIPSGSMRPTIKERDLVLVSKTNFSINTLGKTGHIYFDPNLITRGTIVIFSVKNVDVQDPDINYFYVIPGTKQFIKRLIAKPGDILYFYGGQIYGIDEKGKEISDFRNKYFTEIEHIPFIQFERKAITPKPPSHGISSPVFLYQMNEPVAKLSYSQFGLAKGEMFPVPTKLKQEKKVTDYWQLWGFNNYAMSRILSKKEYIKITNDQTAIDDYYLEFIHHPSLHPPKLSQDLQGRTRPMLNYQYSYLPLDDAHLKKIFHHIYTSRFIVKDERGRSLGADLSKSNKNLLPLLNGVKNGKYEIDNGEAYSVNFLGITKKLSKNHPLNHYSPELTKLLYNLGMEWNRLYSPQMGYHLLPSRYAYMRNHDLYLMNTPVFLHDENVLQEFLEKEEQKQKTSEVSLSETAFKDYGPPIKDGKLDVDLIKNYGLKIPDNMYLLLGDNHANSSDGRDFGFVPAENLRGKASFIFWPPGKRLGPLFQPSTAFINFPKIVIWTLAIIVGIIAYFVIRYRKNKIYGKKD